MDIKTLADATGVEQKSALPDSETVIEALQATLRACTDLEQQAARLKQLVGSFRI